MQARPQTWFGKTEQELYELIAPIQQINIYIKYRLANELLNGILKNN